MADMPSTDVDIQGYTFRIYDLPLKQSRPVLFRVTKALGPAFAAMADPGAGLQKSAELLFEHLTEADLEYVSRVFGEACELLEGAQARRLRPDVQDRLFAGKIMFYLQWLEQCFEHHFADFLGELRDRLGHAQPPEVVSVSQN